MARTASRLLEEQLSIARNLLAPTSASPEAMARQVLRLASLTLELHRKLCDGVPFPAAWLTCAQVPRSFGDDGAKAS